MATKLEIADNVLMNCRTDERQVTIPADVQSVSKYAFDTCPDVHIINLHPDYVRKELTDYIKRMLSEVAEGWDSNLYVPVFPVYNIEVDIVQHHLVAKRFGQMLDFDDSVCLVIHFICAYK